LLPDFGYRLHGLAGELARCGRRDRAAAPDLVGGRRIDAAADAAELLDLP